MTLQTRGQLRPQIPQLPLWFLIFIALSLLANRLVFHIWVSPLPDEAYYWLWGQHPALSYFDHPPLQAWMQAITTYVFGNSLFALRIPSLITTAITIGCLLWWAKGFSGRDRLAAVLVMFASPLYFIFSEMVFNDHLLIALLMLASIFSYKTLQILDRKQIVSAKNLYIAAILIGLAGLTKYNAVLFAFGVFATIAIVPRYRKIFRSPHLYGAALVMLICIAPVFWWNFTHNAASFRYNLDDRFDVAPTYARIARHQFVFLALFIQAVSPFLIPPMVGLWRSPNAGPKNWRPLARVTMLVSTLGCLILTFFTPVLYYWNVVAFIAFLPFATLFFRSKWLLATHMGYGVALVTLFTINYGAFPFSSISGDADHESAMTYGWPAATTEIHKFQGENPGAMLVASDYRNGAILAFKTGNTDVTVLSSRHSQFDFWQTPDENAGCDAIILTDTYHPMSPEISARFSSVSLLGVTETRRWGHLVSQFSIYRGRNFGKVATKPISANLCQ